MPEGQKYHVVAHQKSENLKKILHKNLKSKVFTMIYIHDEQLRVNLKTFGVFAFPIQIFE